LDDSRPFSLIIVAPEDKDHPQLNQHLQTLARNSKVTWIKGFWGIAETEAEVIGVLKKGSAS
jgi:hypothetical protein